MPREGYRNITPASVDRVRALERAIGPESAATLLGTRTRQVERWSDGTGQVTAAQVARISATSRNMDIIRSARDHNKRQKEPLEPRAFARALNQWLTEGGKGSMSRDKRRRIMRAIRALGYGPRSQPPYVKRR